MSAEEPHAEDAGEHGAAKPQSNHRPLVLELELVLDLYGERG